jgi:hypothetical protein
VTHYGYNAELWEQRYEVSCEDPVYEFSNQLRLAEGETCGFAAAGNSALLYEKFLRFNKMKQYS